MSKVSHFNNLIYTIDSQILENLYIDIGHSSSGDAASLNTDYNTIVSQRRLMLKHRLEVEFVKPLREGTGVSKNKIYCELVDKKGRVYLSTKGRKFNSILKVVFTNNIFDLYIKMDKKDIKNSNVNPEVLLILYEGMDLTGDITLLYKTDQLDISSIKCDFENTNKCSCDVCYRFDIKNFEDQACIKTVLSNQKSVVDEYITAYKQYIA